MNPGAVELQEIQVDKVTQNNRCECWTHNIADQFSIRSIKEQSGDTIIEVGPPHEGYSIETTIINGKINGNSKILSPDKIMVASLVFVDGVASGPCKLYDELGILYFKGHMENGLRQGRGTEYDENQRIVFDGFFDKGSKRKIYPMETNKKYWIEFDEDDNIINIGQRNDYGQLKGKCYLYGKNGEITRISDWDEGRELSVIKQFIGNKMIEYKNGVRFYEGCYRDSIELDYPYEGEGKEFGADGQTLVFHGNYYYGKRHGTGLLYKNMQVIYNGIWNNGYSIKQQNRDCCCAYIIYFIVILITSLILYLIDPLFLLYMICLLPIEMCIIVVPIGTKKQNKSTNDETKAWKKHVKTNYSNLRDETNEKGVAYTRPLSDTERIVIWNNCYPYASEFKIDGLSQLKQLLVSVNSFTRKLFSYGNDESKSFHILNCESLESITIALFSFSDFAGIFELKNLPQLQSIQIGVINFRSYNFYASSFVIRGIELILNIVMIRSSKSTIHYIR